jgi:hypothetical protein
VTWLSEDGTRFHARSKQLLDGSASVIIRTLNPKKGWTARTLKKEARKMVDDAR